MRLVYRDFPLPNHDQAGPAAEAAQCAHLQGKFWPYHDKLFENYRSLSSELYTNLAKETDLDVAEFEACMSSGVTKESVSEDLQQAQRLGVNSTPAFFINGRFLSGAQPLEAFTAIIEEELGKR